MSRRMDWAMAKAAGLWSKAMAVAPEFVERYLELCEQLLVSQQVVQGDEFRAYCSRHGLIRPAVLHPNVWVSGPKALAKLGWIEPMGLVEPRQLHNHMRTVMCWRSMIFGKGGRR